MNLLQSKNIKKNLFLIITVAIIFIWSILYSNKSAIVSEGWFITYSDLILSGKIPYKDFEMIFPPLYPYIITIITSIFGHKLIAFRIFGIIIILSISILFYLIFRSISNESCASVITLVSFFTLQSHEAFLSYDYVTLYQVFYLAAFLLLLNSIKKWKDNLDVSYKITFIIGVLISLSFLCRQSSGLIIFAFTIVVFLLLSILNITKKPTKSNYVSYILGFIIPFLLFCIYFALNGSLSEFINNIFLSGTKGSITSMLTSWIIKAVQENTRDLIIACIITVIFSIIIISKLYNKEQTDHKYTSIFSLIVLTISLIVIIYTYNSLEISEQLSNLYKNKIHIFFFIDIFVMILLFLDVCYKTKKHKEVELIELLFLCFSGFSFALEFGAGTSAVITRNEGAIMVGFIIALLFYISTKIKKPEFSNIGKILAVSISIMMICTCVSVKVTNPYGFWTECEQPHFYAQYDTDIPYFEYMDLTLDEKICYESFVNISNNLQDNDYIYCFCQFTIFYTLSDTIPPSTIRAPVSWVDVASDGAIYHDLTVLQNNNPKIIVYSEYSDYYWDQFEKLFRNGERCAQRDMYYWICNCKNGDCSYNIAGEYVIDNLHTYILIKE